MRLGTVATIFLCIGAGCFLASFVVADFAPKHALVLVYARCSLVGFLMGVGLAVPAMLLQRRRDRRRPIA